MKKLLAIFAVVAVMAVFLAQSGFAQESAGAFGEVDAPVKTVMLYSNGMSYVQREGTFESTGADAYVKVLGLAQGALFSSMQVDADGTDAYMQRFFDREVNVTKTEKRALTLFGLLNESMQENVSLNTSNGMKSGILVHADEQAVWLEQAGKLNIVQLKDIMEISAGSRQYVKEYSWNQTERESGVEASFYGIGSGSKTLGISYLSSGASWEPVAYAQVGSAQSGSGQLKLYATLQNNAGEDWEGVQAKVVVGYPHISYYVPYPRYAPMPAVESTKAGGAYALDTSNAAAFSQSGQYYVYTIAQPVSLKSGEWAKYELSSGSVQYAKENVWEASLYGQYPQRVLVFNNTLQRPIAAGLVKVYEEGVFAGEASVQYVPAGKKVEVAYADVSDVSAKKIVEESTQMAGSNARVTTYMVNMTLENFGGNAEKIKAIDTMNYGDMVEFVSASSEPQRLGENRLQWIVDVPAGGKAQVSYTHTVTNYYNVPVYYGAGRVPG